MPLETCPFNEITLAEFALGEGRSRLPAAEYARVFEHVKGCKICMRKAEAYGLAANDPVYRQLHPEVQESLIVGTQNVATRFYARIAADSKNEIRIDFARRWRKRVPLIVIGTAAATVAACLLWLESPPPPPPPPAVIVVQEPGPGALAENLTEEEKAEAEKDARRANAAVNGLRDSIAALPPAEGLAQIARAGAVADKESAVYRNVARGKLAVLNEQILSRVRGTPEEEAAALALARSYLAAGMQREWLQTFQRYAALHGEKARQSATAEEKTDREIDRAESTAKATAYFDEIKRLYDAKDYPNAVQLNDRLTTQYPRTAKAWEGLTVAARAYLANGQPAGSIACYKKIMDECPDELFAREAAKALLKMYLYADQLDNAVEQAKRARERFQDNEFKAFSLTMEGMAQERKGEPSYPAAIRAYREAYAAKTGSPFAEQANERLVDLRAKVLKEMKLDRFP